MLTEEGSVTEARSKRTAGHCARGEPVDHDEGAGAAAVVVQTGGLPGKLGQQPGLVRGGAADPRVVPALGIEVQAVEPQVGPACEAPGQEAEPLRRRPLEAGQAGGVAGDGCWSTVTDTRAPSWSGLGRTIRRTPDTTRRSGCVACPARRRRAASGRGGGRVCSCHLEAVADATQSPDPASVGAQLGPQPADVDVDGVLMSEELQPHTWVKISRRRRARPLATRKAISSNSR